MDRLAEPTLEPVELVTPGKDDEERQRDEPFEAPPSAEPLVDVSTPFYVGKKSHLELPSDPSRANTPEVRN